MDRRSDLSSKFYGTNLFDLLRHHSVQCFVPLCPVQAHNIVGRHLMLTVLREQKNRLRRGKVAINDYSLSHLIFATFRFAAPDGWNGFSFGTVQIS
jgi:hypothetical protein